MSAEGWGDYRSRTVQLIQNKINEGIQILGSARQIKHNSIAIKHRAKAIAEWVIAMPKSIRR